MSSDINELKESILSEEIVLRKADALNCKRRKTINFIKYT